MDFLGVFRLRRHMRHAVSYLQTLYANAPRCLRRTGLLPPNTNDKTLGERSPELTLCGVNDGSQGDVRYGGCLGIFSFYS